mmetsp:Transcript_27855/g.61676  ORF Transcript_27855/g.61676 Transcript_27855/m.61676 type:complete len:235 (-) Transcript_27855:418-1122(-)
MGASAPPRTAATASRQTPCYGSCTIKPLAARPDGRVLTAPCPYACRAFTTPSAETCRRLPGARGASAAPTGATALPRTPAPAQRAGLALTARRLCARSWPTPSHECSWARSSRTKSSRSRQIPAGWAPSTARGAGRAASTREATAPSPTSAPACARFPTSERPVIRQECCATGPGRTTWCRPETCRALGGLSSPSARPTATTGTRATWTNSIGSPPATRPSTAPPARRSSLWPS